MKAMHGDGIYVWADGTVYTVKKYYIKKQNKKTHQLLYYICLKNRVVSKTMR